MQERRKHQRFKVSLPLRVSHDAEGATFHTSTHDVSEGGLSFTLPAPLPTGSTVTCVMNLSRRTTAGHVSFQCQIVRVERPRKAASVKVVATVNEYHFST